MWRRLVAISSFALASGLGLTSLTEPSASPAAFAAPTDPPSGLADDSTDTAHSFLISDLSNLKSEICNCSKSERGDYTTWLSTEQERVAFLSEKDGGAGEAVDPFLQERRLVPVDRADCEIVHATGGV